MAVVVVVTIALAVAATAAHDAVPYTLSKRYGPGSDGVIRRRRVNIVLVLEDGQKCVVVVHGEVGENK